MAKLGATEKMEAARQGLEKLLVSPDLARGKKRKIERLLKNKRALKRFSEDVAISIASTNGADSPILDKLTAIIDWIVANQDKIMAIISFVLKLFAV
jgi:hypothetical protein